MNYSFAQGITPGIQAAVKAGANVMSGRARSQGMNDELQNSLLMQKILDSAEQVSLERAKEQRVADAAAQSRGDIIAAEAARRGFNAPFLQNEIKAHTQGDGRPFTPEFRGERNKNILPAIAAALTAASGKAGDIKTAAEVPGVVARGEAEQSLIADAMAQTNPEDRMRLFNQTQGRALEGLTPTTDIRTAENILARPEDQQSAILNILQTIKPNPNSYASFPGGLFNRSTGQPVPGTQPPPNLDQLIAQMVSEQLNKSGKPAAAAPAKPGAPVVRGW